jgi:hypothetical protein
MGRFEAGCGIALDIARAEMHHDAHRRHSGESLDDRVVKMPRIERVKQRKVKARLLNILPRSGTALFFLDQYGYAEVPATLIQQTSRRVRS